MEVAQLRSLVEVASAGTITAAAEALHLSQPAITQQLRALERELGQPLFDRTGRGMKLTAAGEELLIDARAALAQLEKGRRALQELGEGARGSLSLAAGVTTCIFRLPPWIRAYRERFPQVSLTVRTGWSSEVAALVREHEMDLGIITTPVDEEALEAVPLFEEEIVLVRSGGSPPTGPESPDQLEQYARLVFPRPSGFRQYLDGRLAAAGMATGPLMEIDSVEVIKRFVELGLGWSLLPESAVQAELEAGTLAPLTHPALGDLRRTTSLLRRRDRHLSAAARGFVETLTASLSP